MKKSFAACLYSVWNKEEISVIEIFFSPRVKSPVHDFIAFFASEYKSK